MSNSIFNPDKQHSNTSSKIVAGLERISEAFKVLLWEKAKLLGLSPIQIQILIFIAYHKTAYSNVSHLAKEFNVTKPTISDAIKVLLAKKMIVKDFSSSDSRSYNILLSELGQKAVKETEDFAEPIKSTLSGVAEVDLERIFAAISSLIYSLNQSGILTVQRTCFGCKFFDKSQNRNFCNLLNQELVSKEIRLDCPEFEQK